MSKVTITIEVETFMTIANAIGITQAVFEERIRNGNAEAAFKLGKLESAFQAMKNSAVYS